MYWCVAKEICFKDISNFSSGCHVTLLSQSESDQFW